jgi:hypothetical protein
MFSQNKTRFPKGFISLAKGFACIIKIELGFENKSFEKQDNNTL